MMRKLHWPFGILIAATLLSCGDEGPDPSDAGPLHLVLTTPNVDDGIILLSISGGPVTSVDGGPHQVTVAHQPGGITRVIVRGSLAAGVIGSIVVPDRALISSYTVVMHQAAARVSYVERPVTGYGVALARP